MLSEAEKDRVWEGLYLCEVRHLHYAHLSGSFRNSQTFLTWGTLVSSSGTVVTLVTAIAILHPLVPPLLAIGVTAISSYSLLSKKERKALDSSRLSVDYGLLAQKYEELFGRMDSGTSDELKELDKQRLALSERAESLGYSKRLMAKAQDEVKLQRRLP